MLRISVDCNSREGLRTIVVPSDRMDPTDLVDGRRVVLYEPGMECEAILLRGKIWPWVADIVDGTVKEVGYNDQT